MWAQSDEYKAKVKEAKKIIENAFKMYKKPYVAFSGGKDSTCMLHLVLQQKPDVMVYHWDYGPYLMPRAIEHEVVSNMIKLGAKNYLVETSDRYKSGENTGIWYKDFFGRVTKRLIREGYDAVFVGIRKEESIPRKLRINAKRSLSAINEVWPLQDWSWKDVWAYIFANNLPYPSTYDKYVAVLGWDRARFVTFFDKEFEHLGSINVDGVLMWRWRNEEVFKQKRL